MAAVTANTVYEDNLGSLTLFTINFTAIDTSTYTNLALGNAYVGAWANATSLGTPVSVSLPSSTGVFTLTAATACTANMFVLARMM